MIRPFSAIGPTVNVAVTASAQTLTFSTSQSPPTTLRLCNIGTQTVFVNAQATATTSNGIPILAGTVELFDWPSSGSISVIAAATGSTLYATSGVGN